jgi:hypothetical protein
MKYLEYLDQLPTIPVELIQELKDYVEQQQVQFVSPDRHLVDGDKKIENILYKRWTLPDNLLHWISENISNKYDAIGFQIHDVSVRGGTDHLPHTDSFPRKFVLNYNIQTGGDNVITSFYQEKGQPLHRDHLTRPASLDDLELLESTVVEPFRWHLLDALVVHGVKGIESKRMALSIGFNSENPKACINI